jgi:hypothetical protein
MDKPYAKTSFLVRKTHGPFQKLPAVQHTAEVQMLKQSAPAGQRTRVVLPDSSVIYLNAGSHIRYAANFTEGDTRDVTLHGEADSVPL